MRIKMVTILITGIVLAMALWVFKIYWRDICNWCAWIIRSAHNVLKGVITFVKSGTQVIAYLYRRLKNGDIEKQPIPSPKPVTLDQVPDDVRKALFAGKEVLVNDDVSRPVSI